MTPIFFNLSMEQLQLQFLPLSFAFIIFLFMVFKLGFKGKSPNQASKLPPGPRKLPIIGNLHQLNGPFPHHTLRDLATKYGPFMHLSMGEVSTIVVSSPHFAKEVLKTHDLNFSQRPMILLCKTMLYNYTDIASAPYGDYWRQVRKICTVKLLSAKRVESFHAIREEELSSMIKFMYDASNSPMNLSEEIPKLTNNIVARAAFGNKCKDQERFLTAMKSMMELATGLSIAECYPSSRFIEVISGYRSQYLRIHRELDKVFDNIIEDHKQRVSCNPNDIEAGFVGVLLDLQQQGDLEIPITTDNIKAIILDMFTGGTDTSSTLLEWSMSELMKSPQVMKKAQDEVRKAFGVNAKLEGIETSIELNYLKLVIKETLRLHPPLPLLVARESRENCEIEGYEIPAKTRILINAWAIGRHPQHWEDAETFKPERFEGSSIDYKGVDFEYIPFGAGRRICPGIAFGITNALVPLAHLLYYFDWKLPNNMEPEDLDMIEGFGITVARKSDLYLVPIPQYPLPSC